jgi:hypothetical protein
MNNFDEEPIAGDAGEESGGSLADAIAAHLELKKEHGADPEAIAAEEASALGAANRDVDDSVDLHPADEPAAPTEAAPEPEPEAPEPIETVEPEPAAEALAEAAEEPVEESAVSTAVSTAASTAASTGGETAPAEVTGTFEFEFGEEEAEPQPEPEKTAEELKAEHDLLEDTPDFFQETPEHDKLWFDEAPPKKFDF